MEGFHNSPTQAEHRSPQPASPVPHQGTQFPKKGSTAVALMTVTSRI